MPPVKLSVSVAVAALVFPANSPAQSSNVARDAAAIARIADSLAATTVARGLTPALGFGIVVDGRTVLNRSYGFADATNNVRANERTLWYLASTSKSYTGFGVALLAHDGVLDLNARIMSLLPNAAWHPSADVSDLTLANFLSHTHGLSSGALVQTAAFTGSFEEREWPQLLRFSQPLPTRALQYSNVGYNVAAMVIDTKRPEGWKKFLEDRVYTPAGMRETYTRTSGIDRTRIAMPHQLTATGRHRTESFQKTDRTMNAAGGHLASIGDLTRWITVQMDSGMIDGRRVFPAAAIELSHRIIARYPTSPPQMFAFFNREGWGAGWDIGHYEGERMVSRFGGYFTTRSHLSFLPGRRIGVVALTNGPLGSAVTDVLAAFVYDLERGRADARARAAERLQSIIDRAAAAPSEVATADSVRAGRQRPLRHPLSAFAGTYRADGFGEMVIAERDGRIQFTWGALSGPAEVLDAAQNSLRIEIAGGGTPVVFEFGTGARAAALVVNGIRFARAA